MKLTLKRSDCGKVSTLGEIFVDGKNQCFCIEDVDRQLETYPDNKVYGQTCIPRGTYQVIITYSNRFKRELPLLVDVPGFEGIRIHPGNTAADTEGCLLPCTSWAKQNDVAIGINSREAFRKLFDKIEAALDAGQSVEIEVI
jgi:hypothetical protein